MEEHFAIGLAAIVALGVSAQWIAWRLGIPSILLLLIFGFAAGPVTGLLHPDEIFNEDLLLAFVSLAVGLILYEGGLSLQFREIVGVRVAVRNLVTIAIVVTWLLGAVAAHYLIGLSWQISLQLGAILVVSGPTVIVPLLRFLRPTGQLGSVIKWEGIVNDPIGALLAVLVFEALFAADLTAATSSAVVSVAITLVVGGGVGVAGALLLALLVRRHWIPDYLHNAVSLMFVVLALTGSNYLQPEAGLLTVTVMGVVLANQRWADVRHIIEFKEHLRVLLIASLFILLSARVSMDDITAIGWRELAFVGAMILVVRPLAVFFSTVGTSLKWQERAMLAWLAPRGIVAAAVAAVFSIKLAENFPEAETLGPLTFLMIVATVAVYGLTAVPVARWLGVADVNPQGVLIIGGQSWARALAEALKKLDVRVLLLDSSRANISAARLAGLDAHQGNVLADFLVEELNLQGIGRVVALTPNDEVNALAVQRFERVFGSKESYQLSPTRSRKGEKRVSGEIHGRLLFNEDMTHSAINERFSTGAVFRATTLSENFTYDTFRDRYGLSMTPLFVKRHTGELVPIVGEDEFKPRPGDTLLCLGPKEDKKTPAQKKAERRQNGD